MWRNIAKQVYSRTHPKFFPFPTSSFLVESAESSFIHKINRTHFELSSSSSNTAVFELGFRRSYASAAEAAASSSTDDDSEVQELLTEVEKEERKQFSHNNRNIPKGMGSDKYQRLKNRQVKIETEAWEKAAQEYKELLNDMCEKKLAPSLPYMKSLFLGWFEPFCNKIAEEQELCRNAKYKCYAPYLIQLPAEMIAVITMHKLMSLLMTGGESGVTSVVQASFVIGEAIEHEIRIHGLLERTKKKRGRKKAGSEKDDNVIEDEKLHKKVNDLIKKQKLQAVRHIVKGQDGSKPWNSETRVKLGSRLLDLLLQTAYIQPPVDQTADTPPDIRPAFRHTVKTVLKEKVNCIRRYGAIECDPLVRKGLERTARHMVIPYMPMLVPPVKWRGYDKGAHFYLPSYIMRTHGARHLKDAVKSTPKNELQHVFEALDTLGSTRWRVNRRILTVIDRIWMSGGRLAGLVDQDDIPVPEKPDTEDEELLKKWRWKRRYVKKENMEKYSQRCDIELKLSVARKMKDEEGFYYPHNVDFRGRAYPMHPHLNHLGSDVCRGILEFAEGRPLGSSGLRWLKIHLANLFAGGVDKLSLEGRIAFTENHLDEIFESADRPLEGNQWWLKAEDPLQCLAVCMSLSDALRSSSPENTLSHIPVHQDGSCNGLQHYAALGRDSLGAAAVNLIAGEKPADVYSEIAARVLSILKEDAQKDPSIFPEALHARVLVNQVDRKLVKQTVMTSVYGVTYVGAREQIKRRLNERNIFQESDELFVASCYAAKVTLTALGEMFKSARNIMNWLGDCAKIIASENEPVRWRTPLGLPVVQPYRKTRKQLVRTSLQILTLQRETEKIMVARHKTAFPPNFVHSLDGSHMMMTAVACKRAGLNFAGVHDSYWTHACDVDKLNIILRQKFVELYQIPVLENLLESFQKAFPTLEFPELPERGDLDLNNVLSSPYFFN